MQIPDNVSAFLDKPNVAVLATISPSGRPQATPVWFLVDGAHDIDRLSLRYRGKPYTYRPPTRQRSG